MKKFLSIVFLFIYCITNAGATVYFHQCGQNRQISIFDEELSHRNCPFCQEAEAAAAHHDCGGEGQCEAPDEHDEHAGCEDVKLTLKSDADNEQVRVEQSSEAQTGLSPAILVIQWMLHFVQQPEDTLAPKTYTFVPKSIPIDPSDTYLFCCNFRI